MLRNILFHHCRNFTRSGEADVKEPIHLTVLRQTGGQALVLTTPEHDTNPAPLATLRLVHSEPGYDVGSLDTLREGG